MFDSRHYVPIIKSKAGELWALGNIRADSLEITTPLLEILPPRLRKRGPQVEIAKHVDTICKDIRGVWDIRYPIFLDTLPLDQDAARGLDRFFKMARKQSLRGIPVTSIARSPEYQTVLQQVVATDKEGCMVRLSVKDFRDKTILQKALDQLLAFTGVKSDQVDILLDYGFRSEGSEVLQFLRLHIPQLPYLEEWRTLSVASGSFPKSLLHVTERDKWRELPREEWEAWVMALTSTQPLPRRPAYSDYGIRDPGSPAERGSPSANLRYTCDNYYLVQRGAQVIREHGARQMPEMCRSLVQRKEFSGADFSAGDAEIAELATKADSLHTSPGNPQQWTQWGMSHHFEFVASQIRKQDAP
jgi:Beta protein